MRKFFYLLLIGLFTLQNVCGSEAFIRYENQVILTKKSKNIPYQVAWVPTMKETTKALASISKFLNNPIDQKKYGEYYQNEIKLIGKSFRNYRVQFVGIVLNGKKIIHCNFFPAGNEFSYWKNSYVYVLDGGYSYWRIDFEIDTGKCINFDSNGYA